MIKSLPFRLLILVFAALATHTKGGCIPPYTWLTRFQTPEYKTYRFCDFSIQLPNNFKWENTDETDCKYSASISDVYISINVSGKDSELSNYDLFQFCVDGNSNDGEVTYQFAGDNFFVVSGKRNDGDIFYILRQEGKGESVAYIHIEYPIKDKVLIEPHIGKIKRSLLSY